MEPTTTVSSSYKHTLTTCCIPTSLTGKAGSVTFSFFFFSFFSAVSELHWRRFESRPGLEVFTSNQHLVLYRFSCFLCLNSFPVQTIGSWEWAEWRKRGDWRTLKAPSFLTTKIQHPTWISCIVSCVSNRTYVNVFVLMPAMLHASICVFRVLEYLRIPLSRVRVRNMYFIRLQYIQTLLWTTVPLHCSASEKKKWFRASTYTIHFNKLLETHVKMSLW